MRTRSVLLVVLSAALLSSCSTPFLERAKDPPGWSAGIGGEWSYAAFPGFVSDYSGWPPLILVGPTGYVRRSIGDRWSGAFRTSRQTEPTAYDPGRAVSYRLSGKYCWNGSDAIKLDAGYAFTYLLGEDWPIAELTYLHDFGRFLTIAVRTGCPNFAGIGLSLHLPLTNHFMLHAAGVAQPCSAGLGLGFEWHQPESKKGGSE
jgi:hypothetical protein